MKKNILSLSALLVLALACGNQPSKPAVESAEAVAVEAPSDNAASYTVDAAGSTMRWEGYEGISFGSPEHFGSVAISEGSIQVNGDTLSGGRFVIDMNTITVLDIPAEKSGNAKLTRHLKNEDFFDVPKYPTASFDITGSRTSGADSLIVTGNLTLKGISKSISFPAAISRTDSTFSATTRFVIDRKDWGVVYRSESSLGDKMIRPEIAFEIALKAARAAKS